MGEVMKYLILIAGCPGTGKSYLCNNILQRYMDMMLLSPDDIKEMFWDKYGFKNISEKNRLIGLSWQYYYKKMAEIMDLKKNIISDYPFSDKQKYMLSLISKQHSYNIITIRLIADLGILFERQKQRDLDYGRHLGHILNKYIPGQVINSRKNADGLLSYDEFAERCLKREYAKFALGKLFEVNVNILSDNIYDELFAKLDIILDKI